MGRREVIGSVREEGGKGELVRGEDEEDKVKLEGRMERKTLRNP